MDSKKEFREELLFAKDYRQFIAEALSILRKDKRGFSLAAFARKAGFGSRGFIVDVVSGKKRLTSRSLPKVVKGLGLKGKYRQLFVTLVELSEPDISAQPKKPEVLQDKIKRLRSEIISQKRQKSLTDSSSPSNLYSSLDFLMVYSALGSFELGASLDQILQRTSLEKVAVKKLIIQMKEQQIAEEKVGRFFAINSHVVFEEIGRNQAFQKTYQETLTQVRSRSKEMDCEDKLFFHSTLPLNKSDMPELRKHLRESLTQFVHDHQVDDGDHVSLVQLAFF